MMYDPSSITPDALMALVSQVEKAVGELRWVNPEVICFACTSGSLVIGEEKVIGKINEVMPGVPATTTITAVIAGLRELHVRRIAIGTPYIEEINSAERQYLERRGFDVVNIEGLNISEGPKLSLQELGAIYSLAKQVDRKEAEAVFLSCTGLHAVPILEKLEKELGKPVISSNQASFWYCCKLAGIKGPIHGYGQLLEHL
jgi:maleate isomerase